MLKSDKFSAADLWSENLEKYVEIVVQIERVSQGEVIGEKGRKKEMPFLTMRSAKTGQTIPKPLGINATNGDTIAGIVGSPDVKKWIGLWITLYVTKTEMGKGMRDCIRIRPQAAQPTTSKPTTGSGPTPEPAAVELEEPAFDPSDVQPEDRQ